MAQTPFFTGFFCILEEGFESSSARYEGMAGMSINAAFPLFFAQRIGF